METANSTARMLLVSRDPSTLRCLSGVGDANSWQMETAHSGLEALERLQSAASPDIVLLDLAPDDSDSLHTLRWLRRVCPSVPVILLSQAEDHQRMVEALRLGARDFLIKPCHEHQVGRLLREHLAHPTENELATGQEIEKISDSLTFVAASPEMRKLRAQAELLAQVNVPVLIIGEKGSGKQTVAQLIHELSVRSSSRFAKVSCGALASDQLEQEIFGSDSTASNGDLGHRPGKLDFCHRGTFLLEDVSEMPANLQARMVNLLQRPGIVRRGNDKVELDVRVLATNNLSAESERLEFSGALIRRLSAFTIIVSPLRHHKADIPVLLGHFMKKLSRHYGLPARDFSTRALESCIQYSWPGNVTELENFVKGYLMLGDDSLLMVGEGRMAPTDSGTGISPRGADAVPTRGWATEVDAMPVRLSAGPASLKALVRNVKEEAEKSAIAGALDRTQWNRKAAARLLQISYRALLYKIEHHQMRPPQAETP